jgi:hypothetical protein
MGVGVADGVLVGVADGPRLGCLGTRVLAGGGAARLGLGWTALRRGAGVLWRRLCRSTTRAGSMGSTLGFGEPLLVRVDRFRPERPLALAQRYLQSVQIN